MKVNKENWPEVAIHIEKSLMDFLAQHLEEDQVEIFFEEWRFRLVGSCMNYFDDKPLFETNKKAKQALDSPRNAFEKFRASVEKLPTFARLQFEQLLCDCGVTDMEEIFKAFDTAFDTAENSLGESIVKLKKMKVSESQEELYACETLILSLLQIYISVTKRPLGISRSSIKGKPRGLLFDFVKPFFVIFEPNLKDETLASRIKTAIKKLPLMTGE